MISNTHRRRIDACSGRAQTQRVVKIHISQKRGIETERDGSQHKTAITCGHTPILEITLAMTLGKNDPKKINSNKNYGRGIKLDGFYIEM